jgi:plastocyanin
MTFPVIFIMISNHFPTTTYGYHFGMLLACIAAGAGVRYWFNTRTPKSLAVAAAAVAVMFTGAILLFPDRDPVEPVAVDPQPPPAELTDYGSIARADLGSVEGSVRFEGAPPAREELPMSEAACAAAQRGPLLSETAVVEDGAVANAFVYVKRGLEAFRFPPPEGEVVVDQIGCRYVPHVTGVRTGQRITFVNSDDTTHNVHTVPARNKSANFAMPTKGQRISKQLAKPEVMVKTQCDIHPWMSAYVGVVEHPFFQVTGADGRFSLEGLPPGAHVLEVWHERFGRKELPIQIGKGATETVEVTYREGDHG